MSQIRGSGGILADVDAQGNLLVKVKGAKTQRQQIVSSDEFIPVAVKCDDISVGLRGDRKGNVMTGNYNPEFQEEFLGGTINATNWNAGNTSFVANMSTNGGYNFNSANITTANAAGILTTQRLFTKLPRHTLQNKVRLRANIPTNAAFDTGFGVPSGSTSIVPNGASARCVNGNWFAVITVNSVEVAITNIVGVDGVTQLSTSNVAAEFFEVDVIVDDDSVVVTVQNTQTGIMVGKAILQLPLSATKIFAGGPLPAFIRLYHNATGTTGASSLIATEFQVLSLDARYNYSRKEIASSLGLTAGRNPLSGAQTENHTNSTAPVSATLSNTAAGYTTLGGRFQFVAVAGAVTDYALFAFQVPAEKRFILDSVRIDTRNTGVAVATTATTLEWAVGLNSSAVSLATGGIVRKQVGMQSFAIGAAAEAVAPTVFAGIGGEKCEGGRFVHIILNMPVGTATASQIIRGQVTITGSFL